VTSLPVIEAERTNLDEQVGDDGEPYGENLWGRALLTRARSRRRGTRAFVECRYGGTGKTELAERR
jgi:hypothetical protein